MEMIQIPVTNFHLSNRFGKPTVAAVGQNGFAPNIVIQ